jgi:putative membrane protein insertion efficiency factor
MTLPAAPAPLDTTPGPAGAPRARRGPVGAALLRIIHLYQVLRTGRPSPCRYWPTCSDYAATAIERHGAGRGTLLALRRVARCHPWGGQGIDEVPE